MILRDCFSIEHFFNEKDFDLVQPFIEKNLPGRDFTPGYGPFANRTISNFVQMTAESEIMAWLWKKCQPVFGQEFLISEFTRVNLFLPWDIHADYFLDKCGPGQKPWYNCLIPLNDINSRSIVFDQCTMASPNFSDFKQNNTILEKPIDVDFFEQNLSMCWPDDRYYLSLKTEMPLQVRGLLQAIRSEFFHSSDNFHQTCPGQTKTFLSIKVTCPA